MAPPPLAIKKVEQLSRRVLIALGILTLAACLSISEVAPTIQVTRASDTSVPATMTVTPELTGLPSTPTETATQVVIATSMVTVTNIPPTRTEVPTPLGIDLINAGGIVPGLGGEVLPGGIVFSAPQPLTLDGRTIQELVDGRFTVNLAPGNIASLRACQVDRPSACYLVMARPPTVNYEGDTYTSTVHANQTGGVEYAHPTKSSVWYLDWRRVPKDGSILVSGTEGGKYTDITIGSDGSVSASEANVVFKSPPTRVDPTKGEIDIDGQTLYFMFPGAESGSNIPNAEAWTKAMSEKIGPCWSDYLREWELGLGAKIFMGVTDGIFDLNRTPLLGANDEILATALVTLKMRYMDSQCQLQEVRLPTIIEFPDGRRYVAGGFRDPWLNWTDTQLNDALTNYPEELYGGIEGRILGASVYPTATENTIANVLPHYRDKLRLIMNYQQAHPEAAQFYSSGDPAIRFIIPFDMSNSSSPQVINIGN